MWQTPRVFQSSAHFLHPPTLPLPPTQIQDLPTSPSPSPLTLKQHCPFSRRELAIFTTSSLLLLGPQTLDPLHLSNAKAEENPSDTIENISAEENPPNTIEKPPDTIENISAEENPPDPIENVISEPEDNPTTTAPSPNCTDKTPTKRTFLDISINGEPIGRIVIGLYGNISPAGAARFADLVSGAAGISYRRKEFVKITPNYVQHGGLRSYGVDAELAKKTGSTLAVDSLKAEWERVNESCPPGTKNVEGSVSIMVRDPLKPPPKLKLVAKKGKLEIDEEEVGTDPNGTEFAIATRDSPELDASALVVGRVLEGMEVVQRIGQVKTVQENTSSPYFRVAKLIGDKRAVVAERGFNRPYSKVVVSNCGLLE